MMGRPEISNLNAMPEVREAVYIPIVWLVFYVLLFVHGLTAQTPATATAETVKAVSNGTDLLSADRKLPAPNERDR